MKGTGQPGEGAPAAVPALARPRGVLDHPLLRWLPRRRSGRPSLTAREALQLVPVRNAQIEWKVVDGLCVLSIPLRRDRLARLLLRWTKAPPERMVELDALGSDVWQLCDGASTLEQIVRALMKKHKLGRLEAEMPLRKFMVTLHKRRFVSLTLKANGAAAAK
jgi:hypothetical protein